MIIKEECSFCLFQFLIKFLIQYLYVARVEASRSNFDFGIEFVGIYLLYFLISTAILFN